MSAELPPVIEPPSWHVRVGSRGIWRRRWWEWLVIGCAAMVLVGVIISTVQDAHDRRSPWLFIGVGLLAALCLMYVGWVIQRRATVHVSWEGVDLDPWPLATWTWKNIAWFQAHIGDAGRGRLSPAGPDAHLRRRGLGRRIPG